MDIGDQCRIQQFLCFLPERIPCISFPFGVRHQGRDQLQDILLAVDIGKRIVPHALPEVLGIKDLYGVALLPQKVTAGYDYIPFWICDDEGYRIGFRGALK